MFNVLITIIGLFGVFVLILVCTIINFVKYK